MIRLLRWKNTEEHGTGHGGRTARIGGAIQNLVRWLSRKSSISARGLSASGRSSTA